MNRKTCTLMAIAVALLLLFGAAVALAQESPSQPLTRLPVPISNRDTTATKPVQITATSYITVTTTYDDYTDGPSKKCSDVPPDECTLRRAINQAHTYTEGQRPVAIIFNIPVTDAGYISTTEVPGAWKIEINGTSSYDLRELYGQTIVDGSTQPGGRTDGPKIIIDGLDNHNRGFILRQDENVLRGLAMQNFEDTHVSVSSDDNLIEDCWFGLSDDGMHLSSGDDTEPEADSGVALSASIQGNTLRNNVFTGFFGAPVAIRGDNNVFSGNMIGTRADGTVPIPSQFDKHPCMDGAWVGGSGITVSDNDNQIGGPTAAEGNLFAGLWLELSETATQSPAMNVSGTGHTIQNNTIGLDTNDDVIGICGRGLDFGSGPSEMLVQDNVIVESSLSAILMNGSTLDGNTLRGNLIWRESAWPGKQGSNPFPEGAIAYGVTVPDELRNFIPAQITEIDGTTVTGTSTSAEGSPCISCTIELFLDDKDDVTEALESLVVVTADENGDWTATLPAPLGKDGALRTMSTITQEFTPGLAPGTTSNLSTLYGKWVIFLPLIAK